MLGFEFTGFTDQQKGYLSLAFGVILLLHSLNIFKEWLNGIVIIISLLLIAYGFVKTHLGEKVISLIQNTAAKHKSTTAKAEKKH